jgi:hypothetical protein
VLPLVPQFPGVGVTNYVDAMLRIGRLGGFDNLGAVTMARLVGTHVVGSVVFAEGENDPSLLPAPELAARGLLSFATEYVHLDTNAVFEEGLDYLLAGLQERSPIRGIS